MKQFTGFQYLLIDAANNFGLDKKLFGERIQWGMDNLAILETLADTAETKPLYLKAVQAIRKTQQGIPTGHLVGLDAVCSGIQIMSVLSGCTSGATATGLVDPNVRSDAYSEVTSAMDTIMGGGLTVSRQDAKDSTMTHFYGSKAKPKEIFGEDTPELAAFYQAGQQVAPGAWELRQELLGSWKPWALSHGWKLPDGFDARIKVMAKQEVRIEVDELDHATFTYEFYENQGSRTGLSNIANVTHSVDGYVLRSMHRRCNYDLEMVTRALALLETEMLFRKEESTVQLDPQSKAGYYQAQYIRSTVADVVILPYLNVENVMGLSTKHIESLAKIIQGMLAYKPFALVTVHDEFKALANNMNHVRWQYREILAELADSFLLDDLLSQLHGRPGVFPKLNYQLGDLIRESEYALC